MSIFEGLHDTYVLGLIFLMLWLLTIFWMLRTVFFWFVYENKKSLSQLQKESIHQNGPKKFTLREIAAGKF